MFSLCATASVLALLIQGSRAAAELPWSSPHHYSGKPTGDYSPEWQSYYEVGSLPNITFPLSRNWAGNINTLTVNATNNTAFFWGFEKSNGSLTDLNNTDPWQIWLAGGPGYASTASLLLENGPIRVSKDKFVPSNYSWHQLADTFWVDNPVGVGYSTVAIGGYATSEERMATDFWSFVANLVKVFPNLQNRPLHLIGESYAGRFIPYIMQDYFGQPTANRSTTLVKVACSNPALQTADEFEDVPMVRVIETYPQLIGYDTQVYDYVREQSQLCKLDLNLTYPQTGGHFKTIHIKYGELGHRLGRRSEDEDQNEHEDEDEHEHGRRERGPNDFRRGFLDELAERYDQMSAYDKQPHVRDARRAAWHAENLGHGHGTSIEARKTKFNATITGKINSFFGCDLRDLVLTYALNYTYPWNALGTFDYLDVPYTVNPIKLLLNPHHWMNHNDTRNALHAPHNMFWSVTSLTYPWGSKLGGSDPSTPPMSFMDELAANATRENIGIMWYSGNNDALTTHFSTEVVIQNTTFGGIQGFTVKPNTSWFDDAGQYAGVIQQERGWTYALLFGAGHQTPVINPGLTYTLIRDYFLGNKTTGLVETKDNKTTIHTEPTPAGVFVPDALPDGVLTGQAEIYYGSSTITWAGATVTAWSQHVGTVLAAWAADQTAVHSSETKTKAKKTTTSSTLTSTPTATATSTKSK